MRAAWQRIVRGLAVGAVPVAVVVASPAGAADWVVKTVPRTGGPGTQCVAESVRVELSDGYQTTTAYLTVDRQSVTVTSVSSLDGGNRDIGVVVDQGNLIQMDRLAGPKSAVFATTYAQLISQFRAGREARVQLRFWPEWPATGVHSATFSLIGFTKAYGEMSGCP